MAAAGREAVAEVEMAVVETVAVAMAVVGAAGAARSPLQYRPACIQSIKLLKVF